MWLQHLKYLVFRWHTFARKQHTPVNNWCSVSAAFSLFTLKFWCWSMYPPLVFNLFDNRRNKFYWLPQSSFRVNYKSQNSCSFPVFSNWNRSQNQKTTTQKLVFIAISSTIIMPMLWSMSCWDNYRIHYFIVICMCVHPPSHCENFDLIKYNKRQKVSFNSVICKFHTYKH